MPTAIIDGITTRYEVLGSGPPLLMFSPAGFDASMDKWRTHGVYTRIKPLDHLPKKYSCIVFDRRETGQSGGRVERITWAHYVAQGKGLLDHLGIKRAHLMGGCMGCSPVMAFGVMHPEMVQSMVLYWPVGGAKYRISTHQRFVAASRLRERARLGEGRRAGARDRQDLRRRSARRAVGAGDPQRSRLRRDLREAECRSVQADRHRHLAHAVRPRHRARRRTRRPAAARYPCARRPRPRRGACDLGRALSRGMPAEIRILGRSRPPSRPKPPPARGS